MYCLFNIYDTIEGCALEVCSHFQICDIRIVPSYHSVSAGCVGEVRETDNKEGPANPRQRVQRIHIASANEWARLGTLHSLF